MPRIALAFLALLAVLFVGSELLLPRLAARRVEGRLERDGGEAHAKVRAFPALTLLFERGRALEVTGGGMTLELDQPSADADGLERLEGFEEVRLRLSDLHAGPLEISRFELDRAPGERLFHLHMTADALPRELAAHLGSRAGGAIGALIGGLAGGVLPGEGATRVPVRVDGAVENRDGALEVVEGANATVAGLPLGPLAALVVGGLARRI
ncbi:MAG TPA: hypothetical protein VEQ61_11345 [Thermoleophilaceae bacterium]|nr:hypothetical protein [Thermoleophilaceae bacterium]